MSSKSIYLHSEEVHNLNAASLILPIIINLINPKSIIDIGCGIGTWLSVAQKLGVDDVFGIDGDYVDRRLLLKYLDLDQFLPHDLNKPLNLVRKYDLAICLEVVEHLPESSSNLIIESIIKHADVVLFSAAIPGQCGQNHLNEQYPEYWASKFYDLIRQKIWDNPKIEFWYKQNIFIVAREGLLPYLPTHKNDLLKIHPELLLANQFEFQKLFLNQKNLESKLFKINSGKESIMFYLKSILKYFINLTK